MRGIGKDFIQNFPIAIGVALGASLLVSTFLVPYMCFTLIKKGLKADAEKKVKKLS